MSPFPQPSPAQLRRFANAAAQHVSQGETRISMKNDVNHIGQFVRMHGNALMRGIRRPRIIPHFSSKWAIAQHIGASGLPATIL
jgi:hypothetical protein